jgi:hypothetical protein
VAESAGVINREGRGNDTEFKALIAASPPAVKELASAVRDLVYDVLLQTVEVMWPRQRSVGWGTGQKKFTEQFVYLMPFKGHVTLGFYRGGELADPEGLLPASGGKQVSGTLSMRSLKLSRLEEVGRPALRALIEAATRTGVPGPDDTR